MNAAQQRVAEILDGAPMDETIYDIAEMIGDEILDIASDAGIYGSMTVAQAKQKVGA